MLPGLIEKQPGTYEYLKAVKKELYIAYWGEWKPIAVTHAEFARLRFVQHEFVLWHKSYKSELVSGKKIIYSFSGTGKV